VAYRQNGELGELGSSRPVNRMSGLRRTIFAFCISSVPHLPGFALDVADRFRRSEGKPGFPETRPRKFGAGLGQAAEPGRTFRSVNTRASSIKTSQ
jgi:hypothetical protein